MSSAADGVEGWPLLLLVVVLLPDILDRVVVPKDDDADVDEDADAAPRSPMS